jgi:hypothetical protein
MCVCLRDRLFDGRFVPISAPLQSKSYYVDEWLNYGTSRAKMIAFSLAHTTSQRQTAGSRPTCRSQSHFGIGLGTYYNCVIVGLQVMWQKTAMTSKSNMIRLLGCVRVL